MSDVMLSSKETAELCGVTLNTLQKWRTRQTGPRYYKFGGSNASAIRYKKADVELFLHGRVRKPVD